MHGLPRPFGEAEGFLQNVVQDENALLSFAETVSEKWPSERRELFRRNIAEAVRAASEGARVVAAETHEVERLKWRERSKSAELKGLTAPRFLAVVHSDAIVDSVIHKSAIRAIDPDLMDAVETYIAHRRKRGRDLGDASGLVFASTRPTRNLVSRDISARGKKVKDIVEKQREASRKSMRGVRRKRRQPLVEP